MKQATLTGVPWKELLWIQAPRMLFWYCLVLHLFPLTPAGRQIISKASQTLLTRLYTALPVTELQCQIIHPAGTYYLCPLSKSGKAQHSPTLLAQLDTGPRLSLKVRAQVILIHYLHFSVKRGKC